MSSTIEYLCDWTEALLACSVPYLQLQYFVLYSNQIGPEFYTNCHVMILLELILNKALKYARFADAYKDI